MTRENPFAPVIVIEEEGPIRILILNRPEDLNAANRDMHVALGRVWRFLADDTEARCVVLTGAGRAFSAGGDFDHIGNMRRDRTLRRQEIGTARALLREMIAFPLPIVAAVNGPAVGLGCSLAIMSDLVYMAESAHLADPHVAIGLTAGDGGAAYLPLTLSIALAKEMVFFGDRIPSARALALGLVNEVVADDAVLERALESARRLAALPAQAVQSTKRAMNLAIERSTAAIIDIALESEFQSFDEPEHHQVIERIRSARTRGGSAS